MYDDNIMNLLTAPHIIESNNQILNEKKNNISVKRVIRECNSLYSIYPSVVVNIVSDEITITVSENINNKTYNYKFVLRDGYPFKPPRIFFNGTPYIDFLKMNGDYEKKMVKIVRGQDCLCCYSVNCAENWTPAIQLNAIIDEIKRTLQFKRDVIYSFLGQKIEQKYNVPHGCISSYLI